MMKMVGWVCPGGIVGSGGVVDLTVDMLVGELVDLLVGL